MSAWRLVSRLAGLVAVALLVALPAGAEEQRNMRLVGMDDLQARSAYQPVVHHQGARWIAYVGHHGGKRVNPLTGQTEDNGTSIVDVTDPKHPRYLHHIPGAEGEAEAGGAAMVRICDGKTLPRADKDKTYLLRTLGNLAHEVWYVTDPAKPARLTTVLDGLKSTHKNWWECDTGIAYLVSDGAPFGWRTNRMTKVYDLGDPAHPRFIRDFGLPGQEPGSTGTAPEGVHGPIALRNRVYFAYGTGAKGVMQIVDRDKLLAGDPQAADRFAPTVANLLYPQIGRLDMSPAWGGHTSFRSWASRCRTGPRMCPGARGTSCWWSRRRCATSAARSASSRSWWTSPPSASRSRWPPSRCPIRPGTSAAAEGASAPIRAMSRSARSTTDVSSSSPTSTRGCARWTCAIRSTPPRPASTSPP